MTKPKILLHDFKTLNGLCALIVDGRPLLDGRTGMMATFRKSESHIHHTILALQGWDTMKIAGMATGFDPAKPGSGQTYTWETVNDPRTRHR